MMLDQFPGWRKSGERMLNAKISKSNAIWTVKRLANCKNLLRVPGPEGGAATSLACSLFIRKFGRFQPPDFLRYSDPAPVHGLQQPVRDPQPGAHHSTRGYGPTIPTVQAVPRRQVRWRRLFPQNG